LDGSERSTRRDISELRLVIPPTPTQRLTMVDGRSVMLVPLRLVTLSGFGGQAPSPPDKNVRVTVWSTYRGQAFDLEAEPIAIRRAS
jgi:hypothetical protein